MHFNFKRLAQLFFMLLMFGQSACIHMDLPDNFLLITNETNQIKAITPEGVRLWVRDFPDPNNGDLTFWGKALKHDFVENRGYVLISENDIKDGRDHSGLVFIFETSIQGRPTRELLALFAGKGQIRVVEMAADKDKFEDLAKATREAIASLK